MNLLQAQTFIDKLGELPEPFCIAGKHVVELGSGTGLYFDGRMCNIAMMAL